MRSRWTIYLLLVVVAIVWGVVVWKLFFAAAPPPPAPRPAMTVEKSAAPDTLRLNYPDPFLKGKHTAIAQRPAIARLIPTPKSVRREKIQVIHLGTVASGLRRLYLLTVNGQPCEAERGEMAGEFRIEGDDTDSIYITKDGVNYGVKLCE